jgi:putative hydrolase of the HAD superfamily
VLFDADGVLQDVPGGYEAAAEPYLGARATEFLRRVWNDELPILAGQGELLPMVAAALADFGVTAPLEEVHRAIWLRIEPAEQSLSLVRALRRNGYGVHLGTNQERSRATILFIDDSDRNVASAREAGLAAEQWTIADGHHLLLGILGKHGVVAV